MLWSDDRNAFDEDRVPALVEDEAIRQDMHAVSSLLKMYFRELPNPLCTYQLYDQFVNAVQGPDNLRVVRMREVCPFFSSQSNLSTENLRLRGLWSFQSLLVRLSLGQTELLLLCCLVVDLSCSIFDQVVQQLPPPHFRTLEYLTRHLARVAEHNASTGMTAKNVAIVWAPNLLRCKELEFGGVAALQVFTRRWFPVFHLIWWHSHFYIYFFIELGHANQT